MPSSVTSTSTSDGWYRTTTDADEALACRHTLVSASCTIR